MKTKRQNTAASSGRQGAEKQIPDEKQERAPRAVHTTKPSFLGLDEGACCLVHDMGNILNSFGLYLELISRSVARGNLDKTSDHIDVMKQELARSAQTLDLLREAGRQRRERPAESVDLNELVREACAVTRPLSSVACRVHEELGCPEPFVGCSREIFGALVNLIVNALYATAGSGRVTVRTGRLEDHAWVEVADDGPGMSASLERRAFEPYFTTKGDEGTGLGLATVRTCMQRHSGSVTLDTAAGEGATFTLTFPCFQAPRLVRN
jgi:signal transduction histidine kinase